VLRVGQHRHYVLLNIVNDDPNQWTLRPDVSRLRFLRKEAAPKVITLGAEVTAWLCDKHGGRHREVPGMSSLDSKRDIAARRLVIQTSTKKVGVLAWQYNNPQRRVRQFKAERHDWHLSYRTSRNIWPITKSEPGMRPARLFARRAPLRNACAGERWLWPLTTRLRITGKP